MIRTIPFVNHERIRASIDSVGNILPSARPGTILWIIGPSGVGKSELRQSVLPVIGGNPNEWIQGTIPLISVRAMANDRGRFNPKDLALRMHHAVTEPDFSWLLPEYKEGHTDTQHINAEESVTRPFWAKFRASIPQTKLQDSFERIAKARKLRYLFLEEAGTLNINHLHQSNQGHMENLIRLIEEIGCTLVMFGTHTAATLWIGNAEVLTRSKFHYIKPYNLTDTKDQSAMKAIAKSLGKNFPLEDKMVVLRNFDLFLLNSAGIFGHAFSFLERANNLRLTEGAATITDAHLQASSYTEDELKTVWHHVRSFNQLVDKRPVIGSKAISDSLQDFLDDK